VTSILYLAQKLGHNHITAAASSFSARWYQLMGNGKVPRAPVKNLCSSSSPSEVISRFAHEESPGGVKLQARVSVLHLGWRREEGWHNHGGLGLELCHWWVTELWASSLDLWKSDMLLGLKLGSKYFMWMFTKTRRWNFLCSVMFSTHLCWLLMKILATGFAVCEFLRKGYRIVMGNNCIFNTLA